MSGISGDFRGLWKLIDSVDKLARGDTTAALAQELAAEARKQVADEFREERDPYGNPWAPLNSRKGRILRDTGYMAGHVGTAPSRDGFRLSFLAPYAIVHQNGAHVGPRPRKGGAIPTNKAGKFISKRQARRNKTSTRVKLFGAHSSRGFDVPRRALLPTRTLGGLGPIWTPAFARVTRKLVSRSLGVKRSSGEG